MMNILFLSELLHPHGGGAELATHLYARILSKAGFNVVVVTNRFAGESKVSKNGNLTVYRLPLLKRSGSVKYSVLPRFDVLFSSFMKKLMKWAGTVYIPRVWYSAIPLAKSYGKPVIVHLHDYISSCPLSNVYDVSEGAICNRNSLLCSPRCIYVYEKIKGRGFVETIISTALNSALRCLGNLVKLSDAVICVSKAHRNITIRRAPSLCAKTHVIYNPLPELSYVEIEGDDFGYFGGLNYVKGFRTLYHALELIRQVNPRTIKIHATKFPQSAKHLAKSLKRLGIFPYEKLNYNQYEKLYGQIRAVIVPSVWPEPLPYLVSEAILRGRIVVASNVGGIPEQVEGCKGALLCEAGNYRQLAEAIESVKNLNRETIIDLGFRNRETFLKRFDDDTTIKRFIRVLEHLT